MSVARLGRRMRTEETDDLGVSVSGLAVLARLRREGEQSLSALAAAERVRPPSMTRTVACLESEGLIERHPHPTDGRQTLIRIAPAGRDLITRERRRRNAWLCTRLNDLTPAELAVLREAAPLLERLSNA